MKFWLSFVCVILLFSGEVSADISPEDISRVAKSRYWQLLVHQGESDDPSFYLSPEGRTHPQKEIESELMAFADLSRVTGPRRQHPQCAFPERYRFLKKELSLQISDVECPEFKNWKKSLDAKSVTFVFASSFLNNPTSMFGHTFIRVDSARSSQKEEGKNLWGYGINYGIESGNSPIISVVIFGVIGGFNGYFAMLPYFEKVNEYNDSEDRDLWEYKLNLSPEQMERLSNHLWELMSTRFPYYFFNKNCSSQLLALLDVLDPSWHLLDSFFYPVIPTDSLRAISKKNGAISEITFRPSLYKKLRQKFNSFTPEEKESFLVARDHDFEIQGSESANVLDALIDQQDYKMMKAKKHLDDDQNRKRHAILLAQARSSTRPRSEPVPTPMSCPDLGSETSKLQLYGGGRSHERYFGISFRPALHDLLDWDEGYAEYSEVAIAAFDLRYNLALKRPFHLHELDAIKMVSLSPIEPLNKTFSWTVGAGAFSPGDLFCHDCIVARSFAGAGYSLGVFEHSILYSLAKANLEYSGFFNHAFRAGPSLETGFIHTLPGKIKIAIQAEGFYFPFQTAETGSFVKTGLWFSEQILKDFEIRAGAQLYYKADRHFSEYSVGASRYF